jgi:ParB family transcriptional regulator, chromosome partitioning protein
MLAMSELKKPKSRLGRGLSSLISVSELPVEVDVPETVAASPIDPIAAPPPPSAASSNEIPIDQIAPNPHQPRRQFSEGSLGELAASVKSNGLIQPIVVRRVGDAYQLVAGERRLRAAKLAGLTTIPAIVRDVDSFTQAQLALVENIHREDLNPMERAAAYRSLIEQLGLTHGELATRLGEDRSTVANFIRLLDLAEPVKNLIRDGKLSLGHAKVLAGVADVLEQERLAKLAVSQDLSVRNLERLTQAPAGAQPAAAKPAGSPHMQELEKSFARQLGMRVQIRAGKNKSKGRIIIHYVSLDQFDQLQEKLGIATDAE